jgi:hypothetical protein
MAHMPARGLLWRSGLAEGIPVRELEPLVAHCFVSNKSNVT